MEIRRSGGQHGRPFFPEAVPALEMMDGETQEEAVSGESKKLRPSNRDATSLYGSQENTSPRSKRRNKGIEGASPRHGDEGSPKRKKKSKKKARENGRREGEAAVRHPISLKLNGFSDDAAFRLNPQDSCSPGEDEGAGDDKKKEKRKKAQSLRKSSGSSALRKSSLRSNEGEREETECEEPGTVGAASLPTPATEVMDQARTEAPSPRFPPSEDVAQSTAAEPPPVPPPMPVEGVGESTEFEARFNTPCIMESSQPHMVTFPPDLLVLRAAAKTHRTLCSTKPVRALHSRHDPCVSASCTSLSSL